MPTILSHPAVPLAIGIGLGSRVIPPRLLAAGVLGAIVPDLDVYIHYGFAAISHRGVTHTPAFALLVALSAALFARALRTTHMRAFVFVFIATLSHPVLDMFTNGGSEIPIFWPVSNERYFMPWTPIEVSPIGVTRFLSARGIAVLESELVWVWLPAAGLAALLWLTRRRA
jgi:inner membrane protein